MKKYIAISILVFTTICGYSQELKPALNYTSAETIIKGCIEFADANKVKMAIAIYDPSGALIAFAKMDGSSLGASKVAQWKGLSVATYTYATSETANWNIPNAPDIATIPGGVPIKTKDGSFIGGLGVSGAPSAVDVQCAIAGLKKAGLYFEGETKK